MENFEFEIAESFIKKTGTHLFLTGKAGTGKTTFLRHITKETNKKCIVVAPTGVAAINAGGVTIHSMFGLPTRSFIPSNDTVDPNLANNQYMLSAHFHFHKDKLEVMRELELLIIDEVSMVRADLLDAVDFTLRYVRKSERPFGGVQTLFIGDMYQLPPVVKDFEWPLLSKYYSSPFFFDSHVFKKMDPVYVELRKIYRQSDRGFIQLLNNIRNQDFNEDDFYILKEKYKPDFMPEEPGYITLTTHNKKADAINEKELQKLEGKEYYLEADVTGNFFENMFPAEPLLRLKIGAQVMFLKNDTSGEKRYYNGKIGMVEEVDKDEGLLIGFADSKEKIRLKPEVWENIRYSLNEVENKVEQNAIGTFTQYPLRLAWAITIHKSQGLTFEKAVIDAGESFAAGQVYVALSRCTSMDYLVLHSIITSRNIISDERIVEFSQRSMGEAVLENKLEEGKKQYAIDKLLEIFDFKKLKNKLYKWEKAVLKIKSADAIEIRRRMLNAESLLNEMQNVADKFKLQLLKLFAEEPHEYEKYLQERVQKAIEYFAQKINADLINNWVAHLDDFEYKSKMKKYYSAGIEFVNYVWDKVENMFNCRLGEVKMYHGERTIFRAAPVRETVKKKKEVGGTFVDTLELFKQGKSIAEIAEIRGMASSTIEGHIAKWIVKGEIDIKDLISLKKIDAIIEAMGKNETETLGGIKALLGNDYTFGEIRWVMSAGLVGAGK